MKPEYIYMNVIAPSFILLPVITAFVKYKFLSRAGKVLLFYLVFDSLVSLTSSVLAYNNIPNLPLYHVTTIVETVILLYFFVVIFSNKTFVKYIYRLMLIFPLLGISNSFFLQPVNQFNSYTLSLQSLLVIAFCFLYWWHSETTAERPWASVPLHWIISGLLLYFSSSFILFTFSNLLSLMSSRRALIFIWNLHASLSITMYVMITVGISKFSMVNQKD